MSESDRQKWDERYRDGAYADRMHPTALLAQWQPRLPGGRALDVACGAGRNALFLAACGYRVDAIDISGEALARARREADARGFSVNWQQADLDTGLLPNERYDVIVLVRYVNRALLPRLIERLGPGGHLVCEQHLVTDRAVVGPSSYAFRVAPGELLAAARGLEILFHHEGLVTDPDGRLAALAQLVARRPPPGGSADATSIG